MVNPISLQNFSFLILVIFPMLNLWNLKGPLTPPLGRNFGFQIFPYSFRAKVITNQYTDFDASMILGSALHHISPGVRGPLLRPWTEIFGFQIFLRFCSKPYHCVKFQLPRPSGSAGNFSHVKPMGKPSGAPASAPGQKFWVLKFVPIVLEQQYSVYRFTRF